MSIKEPSLSTPSSQVPSLTESARARRRSILPPGEQKRSKFAATASLVHRNSVNYCENEFSDEQLANLLKLEIEDLKSKDALISLLLLLEHNETQELEAKRKIGCYRLIYPSLKSLNGVFLGPTATDIFIEELHAKIKEVLGKSRASLLQQTYKTGIFEIDASEENNIEEKLSIIPRIATDLLIQHINDRINYLITKFGEEDIEQLTNNITALEDLRAYLIDGNTVNITFGFAPIGHTDEELWLSIRNAECAANMASLEENPEKGEKIFRARNFSPGEMMEVLCQSYMQKTLVLDENEGTPVVKKEWQQFFEYDPHMKEIRMNPEMIGYHRKPEKFRQSKYYQDAMESEETSAALHEKWRFFERYYDAINIIDILKNFTHETFPAYLERIRKIVHLVRVAEKELLLKPHNREHLRSLITMVQEQLTVSLKDSGQGNIKTNRAFINALMESDNPVAIYGDNMDFGILNQRSYEKSTFHLVYLLDLRIEDFEYIAQNPQHFSRLIAEKTEAAKKDPRFQQEIFSIGDEGTRHLRKNETILSELMPGRPVINADGGDETNILFDSPYCDIPEEDVIAHRLHEIGNKTKMRIAVVYGLMKIDPMPEYDPDNAVNPIHREQILKLFEAIEKAEIAHARQKEAEAMAKKAHKDALLIGNPDQIKNTRARTHSHPIEVIHLNIK